MKLKTGIMITVLAGAFVSCLENDIEYDTHRMDYRPLEIAAPVVAKIHVPFYHSLQKELDNTFIDVIDGERVICLRYTHSEKIEWNDEISIDNFSENGVVEWSEISGISVQDLTKSIRLKLTVAEDEDSYVKEAELLTGNIIIELVGNVVGELTISVPGLTNSDGVPFKEVIQLPSFEPSDFPLDNYTLKTDDDDHKVQAFFTVNATGSGSLSINLKLTSLDVKYLSGYFGALEYKPADRDVKFDFFDKLEFNGTFGFRNIKMYGDVINRTGLPIKFTSDICFAFDGPDGDPLAFEPKLEFEVPMATESGPNHTVTPKETSFPPVLLPEIVFEDGNYPVGMKLKNLIGNANPDGFLPDGEENFVLKYENDYQADVEFTIDVPLIVNIGEYNRTDTVPFDYNNIIGDNVELSNSIEAMDITLKIVNSLPFNIKLLADAIDGGDNYVERILDDGEIFQQEGEQIILIRLVPSQISKFNSENVKKIVLSTISATDGFATIKEDAAIDIAVSVHFTSSILSTLFE